MQSSAAVNTFVLAMILHPQVCLRAQAEIDSIIGESRLPDLGDRGSLPYVECVLRETLRYAQAIATICPCSDELILRWNAPLPIGRFIGAVD